MELSSVHGVAARRDALVAVQACRFPRMPAPLPLYPVSPTPVNVPWYIQSPSPSGSPRASVDSLQASEVTPQTRVRFVQTAQDCEIAGDPEPGTPPYTVLTIRDGAEDEPQDLHVMEKETEEQWCELWTEALWWQVLEKGAPAEVVGSVGAVPMLPQYLADYCSTLPLWPSLLQALALRVREVCLYAITLLSTGCVVPLQNLDGLRLFVQSLCRQF